MLHDGAAPVMTVDPTRLSSAEHIALVEEHAAHNYHPLPVVIASAAGAWVTDVEGRRYLDCLAAYSAVKVSAVRPCRRYTVGAQYICHREHRSRQQIPRVRDQVGSRFEPTHNLPRFDLHDCQSEVAR